MLCNTKYEYQYSTLPQNLVLTCRQKYNICIEIISKEAAGVSTYQEWISQKIRIVSYLSIPLINTYYKLCAIQFVRIRAVLAYFLLQTCKKRGVFTVKRMLLNVVKRLVRLYIAFGWTMMGPCLLRQASWKLHLIQKRMHCNTSRIHQLIVKIQVLVAASACTCGISRRHSHFQRYKARNFTSIRACYQNTSWPSPRWTS